MIKTKNEVKTVELNGTIAMDYTLKFTGTQEEINRQLALLSSVGVIDVSTLLMHIDGTVTQPKVTNVECEVEYVEEIDE